MTHEDLPILIRFADLKERGFVKNWQTLLRLIQNEGFPTGVMLGPNQRAWSLESVKAWLDTRPTARKAAAVRHFDRDAAGAQGAA